MKEQAYHIAASTPEERDRIIQLVQRAISAGLPPDSIKGVTKITDEQRAQFIASGKARDEGSFTPLAFKAVLDDARVKIASTGSGTELVDALRAALDEAARRGARVQDINPLLDSRLPCSSHNVDHVIRGDVIRNPALPGWFHVALVVKTSAVRQAMKDEVLRATWRLGAAPAQARMIQTLEQGLCCMTGELKSSLTRHSAAGLPIVLQCFCSACHGADDATLLLRVADFAQNDVHSCSCPACSLLGEPVVVVAHEDRAWACQTIKALAIDWGS